MHSILHPSQTVADQSYCRFFLNGGLLAVDFTLLGTFHSFCFFSFDTGFECRCAGLFCAVHRYSDKHDCTFDYREHGAQEIRRNNPVVVGEKIQKI